MPQEKPFLVVLVTVVFIALGVMGLLSATLYISVLGELTEEEIATLLLAVVMGFGYLVAGYGLYKGEKWGWYLGTAFTVLNIFGNIYFGTYLAITVDAIILLLLLLTAKHYGITIFGRPARPATPVPPPATPIVSAFGIPKEEKRFVKKKHR